MKIIEPKVELLAYTQLPPVDKKWDPCSDMARIVEKCGRVSWQSDDKTFEGSADGFCVRVVNIKKDMSIAEHVSATLLFTTDRYVMSQLTRHRLGAWTVESSHYCNYGKEKFGGEIAVCRPLTVKEGTEAYEVWKASCLESEQAYLRMINLGIKHHQARFVLPGCLKTQIACTMNLRMWRTIFDQRCTPNNTAETVHVSMMAARILAQLCPEIMGDWKEKSDAYLTSKT